MRRDCIITVSVTEKRRSRPTVKVWWILFVLSVREIVKERDGLTYWTVHQLPLHVDTRQGTWISKGYV